MADISPLSEHVPSSDLELLNVQETGHITGLFHHVWLDCRTFLTLQDYEKYLTKYFKIEIDRDSHVTATWPVWHRETVWETFCLNQKRIRCNNDNLIESNSSKSFSFKISFKVNLSSSKISVFDWKISNWKFEISNSVRNQLEW